LLAPGRKLAVEDVGFAADVVELLLEPFDAGFQIDRGGFDLLGRGELGEHEQQDHRPEPAADAVEERQAESDIFELGQKSGKI
jgi:hypothetical protein